ncbi:tumor susceptibility gene 101 protein [Dictyostelium discoideum AX4]|uniref:ESCRT-I complex subunit tsg101 n=1 Tax=Dictyostelium discoideum TaxID=44689 RepID=TS101_DICDI|nr:tumor susceptibility gene 101 protein [Dictyostelium discoideum AX4]Q54LJ3.1 RecName: Full=ESCRT-I complex subunit tsg101 [Dictyostelium discoideum]EAL64154.1 tumor susceptibility gene 101 protein [Dictyostelium discoideum AX4]|eukprot:XP_637568.1 tumor susceptibility gene 101 protein [Dictyostelium discoideum AX4]
MYGHHGYPMHAHQQQMVNPTLAIVDNKMHTLSTFLNYIRAYRDPLRISKDLKETFHLFPNLSPFYENIPNRVNLICIKGTIPICFKGINYYLPIIVWVPLNYPQEFPTMVLDPTPEMRIVKNHHHVNLQGLVYHPYISSWSSNSTMETRVSQQQQPQPPQNNISPPPYGSSPTNNNVAAQQQQPPPPYGSSPSTSNSSSYTQPPPSYDSIKNKTNNTSSLPPPKQPQTSPPPPPTQQQQQQQNNNIIPPPQQPSPPPAYTEPTAAKQQQQQTSPSVKPLPPLPPQPVIDKKSEMVDQCTIKLQELLSKFYDTTSLEIKDFEAHNKSLEELSKKKLLEKEELSNQLATYNSQIDQLNENIEQLEKWINENDKSDSNIDIDQILGPKDSLSKQLLKLVSDDSTIEDLLYYLDKALHSNRISLEEYLKNVRSLSRDQFIIRATVKKVQFIIRQNQQQLQQQQQQQNSPQRQQYNQQQYFSK